MKIKELKLTPEEKEKRIEQLIYAIVGAGFLDLIKGEETPDTIIAHCINVQCDVIHHNLHNNISDSTFLSCLSALDTLIEFCGGDKAHR